MFGVAFNGQPYGGAPWGEKAGLAGMTAQVLQGYWRRVYVPADALLVIVGNVKKEEATEAAQREFGDWEKVESQGSSAPSEKAHPSFRWTEVESLLYAGPGRPVEVSLPYGGEGSLAGVGFVVPGAGPSDEHGASDWGDVAALDVLYAMLGQGTKSRLNVGIRDEGTGGKRVGCEFLTQRGPGLFCLWAQVEKGHGKEMAEALMGEVGRLSSEVAGTEEVERAKRIVKGSYAFSRETLGGEAKAVGFYGALGEPGMAEDYGSWIESVTPEDIHRVCQRYLDLMRRTVVVME
jgi:zinc protease